MGDRDLPANIDAERVILGAILLDSAYYRKLVGKLSADDFSLDTHRRIFLGMYELDAQGRGIDTVLLVEWLKVNKQLEHMGETPVAYVASLTEGVPRRVWLFDYLRIVREKRKLRHIIGVCERAMSKAYEQADSAESITTQLNEDLEGINGVDEKAAG